MHRVAVISDIHSNLPALNAITQASEQFSVDEFWVLGDVFGYCAFPVQVYDFLNYDINVSSWLAGNHDLAISGDKNCLDKMNNCALECAIIQANGISSEILREIGSKSVQRPISFDDVELFQFYLAHGFPSKDSDTSVNRYVSDMFPQQESGDFSGKILDIKKDGSISGNVWVVGHSHQQLAWHWKNKEDEWEELIKDFGMNLSGKRRVYLPNKPSIEVSAEFSLHKKNFNRDDLVIINCGSVGFPRDGVVLPNPMMKTAKFLILEISEESISGKFITTTYDFGADNLEIWRRCQYPECAIEMLFPKNTLEEKLGETDETII